MKILFVTTCYPSPQLTQYCVFLEQQAVALQELGHTVDVYHLSDAVQQSASDYLFHGVQVYYRNIVKKKKKVDLFLPTQLSKADEENLSTVLANGYDVVSFHFGGIDCLRSVQKVCSLHDIPLIQHFHGLNVWGDYFDKHPWLTAYHNQIKIHHYKKLSATVNVSNKVRDIFKKRVPTVLSYTVYNGVDMERFPKKANRRFFEDGAIRILCVGNLIPIKGQKYLIEAVAELSTMGHNVEVAFAGRGSDEEMLRELAVRKSVNAQFLGYLPYDEIAQLMQTYDIFVMPSFYEALGCVYLEAMSAGMITVGVHGQGIDEIIEDGINGFLVEPKSVTSIAEVVNRIIDLPPDVLYQIAKRGHDTSSCYTWEASSVALQNVYLDVLNGRCK